MKTLYCMAMLFVAMAGCPALAEEVSNGNGPAPMTAGPRLPLSGTLKKIPIYLQRLDGRWTASLSGDIKNPAIEQIVVSLPDGSYRLTAEPLPKNLRWCAARMKDRAEYGYMECNSEFFPADKAATAATTVLRGILTLGIKTLTDASSGNTPFSVSLDPQALKEAVIESKAIELAKESAPLLDYRAAFAKALSSQQLRTFVATFEGVFDPDSLVAKAKDKIASTQLKEEALAQQKAAAVERQAEWQRQQDIQMLNKQRVEQEALAVYQKGLRVGDRVMVKFKQHFDTRFYGMIIELKPPLAYVQWENINPPMQWVRIETFLIPR